jgi:hypothetical protein
VSEQNTAEAQAPAPVESGTETVAPVAVPPKDRRKLRAVLRWSAAVLVFAAAGTGAAYGMIQPERTDIPGLSTLGDGRWDYPVLARPALPAGAPLPMGPDNDDRRHYAPLRSLLLPAPAGSRPDATVKTDRDGVVSTDAFLEEYAARDRETLGPELAHEGLIQIVARAWTMPDGTRSRVYLLRFQSAEAVDAFKGCRISTALNNAETVIPDVEWGKVEDHQQSIGIDSTKVDLFEEAKPYYDEQTRLGCIQVGDVQAVILQSRKGESPVIPLHQAVILQGQLLG